MGRAGIGRRLASATDVPIRMDDTEAAVLWRIMDKPRLIDSERWREFFNALSRSQGLREFDIKRYVRVALVTTDGNSLFVEPAVLSAP